MTSKMYRLAELFAELEADISRCSKCGMCQAVCPLYAQTRDENDVARGKLALLDAVSQKMFDRPQGVLKRLNRCLLCGSCASNCPNEVDAMAVFLKARTILTEFTGLSPLKKIIFKKILANPGTLEKWIKQSAKFQKWVTKPESDTLKTVSMRFTSLLAKRHFLPLADTPFYHIKSHPADHDTTGTINAQTSSNRTILFYPGCLINYVFPNVGMAVLKTLGYHKVNVLMPDTHYCCGMPTVSAGDAETTRNLIHQNLLEISRYPFDHIITACPTCAYAIKTIWPMFTNDLTGNLAGVLGHAVKNTMDISQFIYAADHREVNLPDPDAKIVTYHEPCHLKTSLGTREEPRMLITANPGYQLREMKDADHCCGMGGSFGIEHFEFSSRIGEAKLTNILTTNCDVVATGCPACMLQISHILSQNQSEISVKHPVEIYAEKLNHSA